MKEVAATHHLFKREGVWYYRRRVPLHLVERAGCDEKRRSLGTKDKAEAKRLATVADLSFNEWVLQIEGGALSATKCKASSPFAVTPQELAAHISDFVQAEDARRAARLRGNEAKPDDLDTAEVLQQLRMERDFIHQQGNPDGERLISLGHKLINGIPQRREW